MSVFIVDLDTINRILTWLSRSENRYSVEYALDMDMEKSLDIDTIGKMMVDMNVFSFRFRYGEEPGEKDGIYEYEQQYMFATDANVLTSLRCWMYQCDAFEDEDEWYNCTEEETKQLKLYKALKSQALSLAIEVIEAAGLYDREYWR